MTSVNLVWITPNADQLIADMARVSSPANVGKDATRLIRYLIAHKHWSPFEMASACIEIETTRAISPQLLRHRSFSFQEFSQRYADVVEKPPITSARKPAATNRQSSEGEASADVQQRWQDAQNIVFAVAQNAYRDMVNIGVPREQARMLLPLATPTRLYMAGTLRSWIHYLQLRTAADTQAEHREIAEAVAVILKAHAPLTFAAAMEVAS
jgi:thymidylate synthase (FAD)